ncbi:MAG: DNA-directed RNA polymerase subunit N [Halobacteriales archaeon]
MMIPVRCFTCGRVIGEYWDEYRRRAAPYEGDEDPAEVLDDLGIDRYCCRRMFVSHTDLVDVVSPYQ